MTEETFLRALLNHVQDGIEIPVTAYVGDKVEKVEDIYRSFHTAIMALSFQTLMQLSASGIIQREQRRKAVRS